MALTGIHFLLTYACTHECDHCFLYCSPRANGTFTASSIREVLEQGRDLGTIEWIYFEGGEPFLYYPVLIESLRTARSMGFKTGVVTNCYWATSDDDARLWLEPILAAGIDDLSVSDDELHHGAGGESPGARAARVATTLGLPVASICIEKPEVRAPQDERGQPVVGGGVMLRGRAVDTYAGDLPIRDVATFTTCPYEDLVSPGRVHVDAFGHVHICQGISIGNLWKTPLAKLMAEYDPAGHPICGPLLQGGPSALAEAHGVETGQEFVDECHHCFVTRRSLLNRFPDELTPRQVYGTS